LALFTAVASGFLQSAGCSRCGESLIPENHLRRGERFQGLGKGSTLLGGGPIGAVHVPGQSDDDRGRFLLRGYGGDLGGAVRPGFQSQQGVGHAAQFIAEGEADPDRSGIDPKDA